ncbi:hypothetical protein KbCgl_03120 [Corynebacterium glutamicum]|nr:hypothetical protein KbCgl_03120 [Corynebacterium glutamicum]
MLAARIDPREPDSSNARYRVVKSNKLLKVGSFFIKPSPRGMAMAAIMPA